MSIFLGNPNKKCTFANRVVRRSKSQNISALALSLNRYHKSATPSFQSDTQSDTSFLIIPRKDNIGYVCSRVIGTDGRAMNTPSVDNRGKNGFYPDFCDLIEYRMIKVSSATFVSVLVPCSIIKSVGLPYKEFFIWGDDTEFTLRISSRYDCYMSCNSVVMHKRAIQKQLTIEEEKDKKRLKNYFYNIRNCGFYTNKYCNIQEKIIYHLWIWKLIISNITKPYKVLTVLRGYFAFFGFRPQLKYPQV